MSLVVREDLSVPISEEMAEKMGIHPGSPVRWELASDGGFILRAETSRKEAIDAIRGAGRRFLKPGESGVEGFLKWRQEERELDDTY